MVQKSFEKLLEGDNLTDKDIKIHLDNIYDNISKYGIDSELLIKLIPFLSTTGLLSTSTKVYLIENCLIPNSLIPDVIIRIIIRYLGSSTFLNPYKFVVPKPIQISLVKWICHVYAWFKNSSVFEKTYSIWFHLWKYDYLQDWITYILIWSTKSAHITPWRCYILRSIGDKVGYINGRAMSTLILFKFRTLSDMKCIQTSIDFLHCNSRRLNSIKTVPLNEKFMNNWKTVLEVRNVMEMSEFDQLITCQLSSIRGIFEYQPKPPSFIFPTKGVPINEVTTIEKFAQNIDQIYLISNPELLIHSKDDFTKLYMVLLDNTHYHARSIQSWTDIKMKNCDIDNILNTINIGLILDFPIINMDFLFLICKSVPSIISTKFIIHHFASINIEDKLEQKVFLFRLIKFVVECRTMIYPVVIGISMILFKNIHLKKFDDMLFSIKMCSSILYYICYSFLDSEPTNDQICSVFILLNALESLEISSIDDDSHSSIFILPDIINMVMSRQNALLTSIICESLVRVKDIVKGLSPENKHIKNLNKSILDIANYLWRYKALTEDETFGLPSKFWNNLGSNLYITDLYMEPKLLFNLLNGSSYNFICRRMVFIAELNEHCNVHYANAFTESAFKSWKKDLDKTDNIWLKGVSNFENLKKLILDGLMKDGTYMGVTLFLYTYIKTLAKSEK